MLKKISVLLLACVLSFFKPALAENIDLSGWWTIQVSCPVLIHVVETTTYPDGRKTTRPYDMTYNYNGTCYVLATQAADGSISVKVNESGHTMTINGKVSGSDINLTYYEKTTSTGTTITVNATAAGKIEGKTITGTMQGRYQLYAQSSSGGVTVQATGDGTLSGPFNVKMEGLDTLIDTHPASETDSKSAKFTWHATGAIGGVTGYYYQLDDNKKLSTTATSITFDNLKPGKHIFYVAAQDKTGSVDKTPAIWEFKVKDVKPAEGNKNYINGINQDDGRVINGDPVNVTTGNMVVETSDFVLPGKGFGFDFTRTYNSRDDYQGPLGYGWTHSYNVFLTVDSATKQVKLREGEGKEYLFNDNGSGNYVSQRGDYSKLTKTSSNYIWQLKNGVKYIFATSGKLAQIIDPNSNTITFAYNKAGQLVQINDTCGRIIKFTYDAKNRIISLVTPANKIYKYVYDSANNLISVTDPKAGVIKYFYDTSHNIVKKVDKLGNPVYFTYDSSDRCTSTTRDSNYERISLSYGNGSTVLANSKNNKTTYYYNKDWVLTKIVYPDSSVERSTWDANINRTSHTDQLGHSATFEYDGRGNLIKITDPLGNVTTSTYESTFNRVTNVTDALGKTILNTYDTKGNLTKTVDQLGNPTYYLYNPAGQITAIINAYNKQIYNTYDTAGNLASIKDLAGVTVKFGYDTLGNKIKSYDPKGNLTQYAYDELNRLVKVTYPNKTTNLYAYDAAGNRISVTDGLGKTTTYRYDPAGEIKSQTNPKGGVITYLYDTEGNLSSLKDQNNNQTAYEYDALNRLVSKTDALNYKWYYSYDAAGNRVRESDPKGQTFDYLYDELNRVRQISGPDTNLSYSYDGLGRKISTTDGIGTSYYTYDAAGRVLTVDGPLSKDTLIYTYDKVGNRLTMVDPEARTTKYAYDAANRIIAITDYNGVITKYTYDAVGNLASIVYPNKTVTSYVYDSLNRLSKITNQLSVKPNTKISEFTYTYDALNRKIKVVGLEDTYEYGYDSLGQLASERRSAVKGVYLVTYAYDAAGNRLTKQKNNTVTKYNYNQLNQLTREVTGSESIDYNYDNNGNLIRESSNVSGQKNYSFDGLNRLNKVAGAGLDEAYKYDGQNRRVEQASGAAATSYLYDGNNVILERVGSVDTSYQRNPLAAGGIGGIISSRAASTGYQYYHYDALGSTVKMTGSSSVVTKTYSYDAFGNIVIVSGSGPNNRGFLTKEADKTGLIYFGERYYNPRIGRFITPDPSGMADGPNLYVYCLNDPVNAVDLWGLCEKKATAKFKWYDITSWFFPGTNYCGWTRSGPGEPTSKCDACCQQHDQSLGRSHYEWWQIWNKNVMSYHNELINCWATDDKNKIENNNWEEPLLWNKFRQKLQ